ncbi:MAG: hypothetical protein JWQ38_1425 [Flavipsychrobacter sp.]|nr:hypothetical protein [Flavipsychrobacter sp.]
MPIRINNPEKKARIATIATLSFIVCWGACMVLWEIKPFWIDEWRVIYNLKFKDATMLWGQLDYLQQFPRVYLQLVKTFTSFFDYGYTSLRVPSFIVGTTLLLFSYRLMNKIYSHDNYTRFLFVMILVSASTFTDYYVQIKQYTMDLLLPMVAIWQLIELLRLKNVTVLHKSRYALLCSSFAIAPFFSYTYPITIAPVFLLQLLSSIQILRRDNADKINMLIRQLFPLLLCTVSICIFYVIDVAQLMKDKGMQQFWGHLMMTNGFSWHTFFYGLYNLFAEIGSGTIYWYLFGILGILSFIYGIYFCIKHIRSSDNSMHTIMVLYSVILLLLMIVLFLAGKYPLGEPRLNACSIPAISILIIHLLDTMNKERRWKTTCGILSLLLLAGVTGNIYSTCYASFTGPSFTKKMNIYRRTEQAIHLAESKNIPILITPGITWPYEQTLNLPYHTTMPGDWVLKTYPAYHVAKQVLVYPINSITKADEALKQLPQDVTTVLVGNGEEYQVIKR